MHCMIAHQSLSCRQGSGAKNFKLFFESFILLTFNFLIRVQSARDEVLLYFKNMKVDVENLQLRRMGVFDDICLKKLYRF